MADFEAKRRRIFEQHARTALERLDRDAGVIPLGGRASFGAHVHAQGWDVRGTGEAAAALAMAGHDELAWKCIGNVLDYQDTNPASMTFGNFFWYAHWTKALDPNAVSFTIPPLAFVYKHCGDRLPPPLRERLRQAFDLAFAGLNAHRATWGYTNIALLNLAAKMMVADALDRDRIRQVAYWDWEEWRNHTARLGVIPEFNSLCYSAVQIHALAMMLDSRAEARFHREVRAVMRHLIAEAVLDYHPDLGRITGPQSRAYEGDRRLRGASGMDTVLHFVLGTPPPASGCFAWFGAPVGPADLLPVATDLALPRTTRAASHGFTRTNYLAPDYALGSVSGRRHLCGITVPFFLAFRSREPRCSLAFVEDGRYPADVHASTQREGALLAGSSWLLTDAAAASTADPLWWEGALSGLNTGRPGNSVTDPAFLPGYTVELGRPDRLALYALDGTSIHQENGDLASDGLLVETETVFVGLRFAVPGHAKPALRLIRLPDGELTLDVRGHRKGLRVSGSETAVLCAFLLQVVPRTQSVGADTVARRLGVDSIRLRQGRDGWRLSSSAWDGTRLSVAVPARPGCLYSVDGHPVTPNRWVQSLQAR